MSIILKDYQHARKAFIEKTDPGLMPKSQFLFHVYIDLNPALYADPQNEPTFSILVKNIELPKFTVETKTYNAYNRPNVVQTKVKYEPITIKFHDDSSNTIRNLWENYYKFYYQDSNLGVDNNGAPQTSYFAKHKYEESQPQALEFGYSPSREANGLVNVIKNIRIYSLHGGQYSLYVLVNPIIKRFNHGTHDYSQSDVLEHDMTVEFETVLYSSGSSIEDVKGFTSVGYDKSPSPIDGEGQENTNQPDKLTPKMTNLNGDMNRLMNNRPELVADDTNSGDIDLADLNINQNGIDVFDPRLSGTVSENFNGIDAISNQSLQLSGADPSVYDTNPVTQALYTETTSKGFPLLNPTNTPTQSPANLLTADRVSFANQTNQQGFPDSYTNAFNINNLNNKISNLSVTKNTFAQQTVNSNNVLSILQNKKSTVASLPQTPNNIQLLQQINSQIADTQSTKNVNQNQVAYYENELSSTSIDLLKYIG